MTINEIQDEIIDEFSAFDDWMDKYNYLIEMGQELDPLPEKDHTPENLIDGCQSRVWITAGEEDGRMIFRADSDAILVKGLIALLLRVVNEQKAGGHSQRRPILYRQNRYEGESVPDKGQRIPFNDKTNKTVCAGIRQQA